MIKWIINLFYRHNPECFCGYKMKSFESWTEGFQWVCIWKKCGWEMYETFNGKSHWMKSE